MEILILWLILLPTALVVEASMMGAATPLAWVGTIFLAVVLSRMNREGE